MNSFFTWYVFLEVGKTQDLPSKIWQVALIRKKLTSPTPPIKNSKKAKSFNKY
jgi:hypothetical protein